MPAYAAVKKHVEKKEQQAIQRRQIKQFKKAAISFALIIIPILAVVALGSFFRFNGQQTDVDPKAVDNEEIFNDANGNGGEESVFLNKFTNLINPKKDNDNPFKENIDVLKPSPIDEASSVTTKEFPNEGFSKEGEEAKVVSEDIEIVLSMQSYKSKIESRLEYEKRVFDVDSKTEFGVVGSYSTNQPSKETQREDKNYAAGSYVRLPDTKLQSEVAEQTTQVSGESAGTLEPTVAPSIATQATCYASVSISSASSMTFNGVQGNVGTYNVNEVVNVQYNWNYNSGGCSGCIVQLYVGIVGTSANCVNTCCCCPGNYLFSFSMSKSVPGCYHVFSTVHMGYYCGYYGSVYGGGQIGAIWITGQQSTVPSSDPSASPTVSPTWSPSVQPSTVPSSDPSTSPTVSPTWSPSVQPSIVPSSDPSASPTVSPTWSPSVQPSTVPSSDPSASPTVSPTWSPSVHPSAVPSSDLPSVLPSIVPSVPSVRPSVAPTVSPTVSARQNKVLCELMAAVGRSLTSPPYSWTACSGKSAPTPCLWSGTTICATGTCPGTLPNGIGCRTASGPVTDLSLNIDIPGRIPTSIGFMAALTSLKINGAKMTGYIPSTVCFLNNMKFLQIGLNSFSGYIPDVFRNMTSLVSLDISREGGLTGSLPTSLCAITSLTNLKVSSNSYLCYPACLSSKLTSFDINRVCEGDFDTVNVFGAHVKAVYIDKNVGPLSPQNQNVQKWKNNDYCYFLKSTKCNTVPNLVSLQPMSIKCPPALFSDAFVTYCATMSTLVFSCPGVKAPNGQTNIQQLQRSCIDAYLQSNAGNRSFGAVLGYEFNVSSIANGALPTTVAGINQLNAAIVSGLTSGWNLPLGSLKLDQFLAMSEYGALCDLVASSDCKAPSCHKPLKTYAFGWSCAEGQSYDSDMCSYEGVTCKNGHVVQIDIRGRGLQGTLPTSLQKLFYLTSLVLSRNSFIGTLPGELMNIPSILLSSNEFFGVIPTQLGSSRSLITINLQNNELDGQLPQFSNQSSLQFFILRGNKVSGSIPTSLASTSKLLQLDLRANKLSSTIPSALGSLAKLMYLNLGTNKLSGTVPTELLMMPSLIMLNVVQNSLVGSFPSVAKVNSVLQSFTLDHNKFDGNLTYTIGNLVALTKLSLRKNSFSGPIPSQIGALIDLQSLDVGLNSLTGSLPSSIGQVVQLTYLDVSQNFLHGSIPTAITSLTNVLNLFVQKNLFAGTIPSDIGALRKVNSLIMSANMLTGQIPDSIVKLTALQNLYLSYNQLTGVLPKDWSMVGKIKVLALTGNSLGGSIPRTFSNASLEYLYLSGNRFSSSIPVELGQLIRLKSLLLSQNRLNGPISDLFDNFINMKDLMLSSNSLTGVVPESLCNMTTLQYLFLAKNKFNCYYPCYENTNSSRLVDYLPVYPQCPTSIAHLHYLAVGAGVIVTEAAVNYGQYQVLCDLQPQTGTGTSYSNWKPCSGAASPTMPNPCSGPWIGIKCDASTGLVTDLLFTFAFSKPSLIPPSIGAMTSLTRLVIQGANMNGYLPSTLVGLTKLQVLRLSGNRFKGYIPSWIGGLSALVTLDVSGESGLTGSLPASLCSLNNLATLSGNKFACYPGCLASRSSSAFTTTLKPCSTFLDSVVFGTLVRNVYLNAQLGPLSPQNPDVSTWINADFCYYFKQTTCSSAVNVATNLISSSCPPIHFSNSVVTYCTTFAKFAYGCGVQTITDTAKAQALADTLEGRCIAEFLTVYATTRTYASFSSEFDINNVQASKLPTDLTGQQALIRFLEITLANAANKPVKSIKITDLISTPTQKKGKLLNPLFGSALLKKTFKLTVSLALETMGVSPGATSAIAARQLTKNDITNAFVVTGNGSSQFMIQLKQTASKNQVMGFLVSPQITIQLGHISVSKIESEDFSGAFDNSTLSKPKLKSDIIYAETAKPTLKTGTTEAPTTAVPTIASPTQVPTIRSQFALYPSVEPSTHAPSVKPSLAPTAPSQKPTVMTTTDVLVTSSYDLVIDVPASSFEEPEKAAFKATLAVVCNVSLSAVVITSVTDAISPSSGHLVEDIQSDLSAVVKFILYLVLQNVNPSAASLANFKLTSVLTDSLSDGSFVRTLQSTAIQYGSTALTTASASSSGLTSNGFTQTPASSPTVQPNGTKGKSKGKDLKTKTPKMGKVTKAPKAPKSKDKKTKEKSDPKKEAKHTKKALN